MKTEISAVRDAMGRCDLSMRSILLSDRSIFVRDKHALRSGNRLMLHSIASTFLMISFPSRNPRSSTLGLDDASTILRDGHIPKGSNDFTFCSPLIMTNSRRLRVLRGERSETSVRDKLNDTMLESDNGERSEIGVPSKPNDFNVVFPLRGSRI
jgi:hypothetical protein